MWGRRLAFWVTVGGVSLLAHAGLELAARKLPQLPGLKAFNDFIHCGPGGQG